MQTVGAILIGIGIYCFFTGNAGAGIVLGIIGAIIFWYNSATRDYMNRR